MSRVVAVAAILDTRWGEVVVETGRIAVMMDVDVEFQTAPFGIAVHRNPAAIGVFGWDHDCWHGSVVHNVATNNGCSGYDDKYNDDHYHHYDHRNHDNYH